jgi:hypothetical protein
MSSPRKKERRREALERAEAYKFNPEECGLKEHVKAGLTPVWEALEAMESVGATDTRTYRWLGKRGPNEQRSEDQRRKGGGKRGKKGRKARARGAARQPESVHSQEETSV